MDVRDPEKAEHVTDGSAAPLQKELSAEESLPAEEAFDHAQEGQDPLSSVTTTRSKQSMGTALGTALTGIEVRKRSTKEGGEGNVFVVGYEGERDIMNPHNWSRATRIGATINIASIGWIVGFASSVDSAALMQASEDFGVSQVTESLATGIFLIGFGVGALFAGPISETIGRNPVYIATLSLYMIFIMASALAPNIRAQLAFRFIAGCFASTPLTCAGGSISDLWSPMERVYAFPVFANAAFMGPIFGPVVGGFIGESSLVSWRWTEWITLIISGLILILVILFQPETYAPILLNRDHRGDQLGHALYRPFLLTFREPIIMLIALYLTVIYIILFTFLNGYTFIFTETHHFSEGLTGLSFLGIGIGLCLASSLVPLIHIWAKRDLATIQRNGGTRLPPEFRLWFAMLGAPAIPLSLLWMAWTSSPSISPWSPLAASVLFLCVFISCYQYIIDSYESYSASALASVTLIRYVAAGGMVEVAIPFYERLGVRWTVTILAGLSALLVPVPYAFFRWGPGIRGRSRYAVV
ncbi:efflux pump kojT [Physcia stellaris]|nr:efflux pump kojT [Physcia stellaris]